MNSKHRWIYLSALSAGCIAAPMMMAACAATPTQESTGEVVDDSWITTKVKAAFVDDSQVSALHIKVDTFKGTVQLSGFANSTAEADRAVTLARGIKGVKAVRNDIEVKTSN